MMRKWALDHPRVGAAVLAAAFASLVPLTWLQYRWISEISQAERERLAAHMNEAAGRLAEDFDGAWNRLARALLTGPMGSPGHELEALAARCARLEESGADPRLIRNFYFVNRSEMFQYDRVRAQFQPASWPANLEPLRGRLASRRGPGGGPGPRFSVIDDGTPALAAPLFEPRRPGPFGPGRGPGPGHGEGPPPLGEARWLVLELDAGFLTQQFLPSLVGRHLTLGDSGLAVRIVSRRDPDRVIYASDPALPAGFFSPPDASATLFDSPGPRPPFGGGPGPPPGPGRPPVGKRERGPGGPPEFDRPAGGWRLLVKHRAGSLENAVAHTRRRNLGVSFAILLLMAGSLGVLLVSTRRAQRLARLQMEFVAGVSHELRTPLSVICSAADNLADGLVGSETQVRRYGAVIRGEGRRLAEMVEQILGFAGIQSGRAQFHLQPVDIGEVIHRALTSCDPEIRAAGCTAECHVDAGLPLVQADATSLSHALRNLIDNAVTHGGGKWIGVRAKLVPNGRAGEVEVAVEDRGPGIEASELPRIFDPFYRGRRAVEDQVHGFGLGLALAHRIVQAHGGSLTVHSAPGQGTQVALRLPALRGVAPQPEPGAVSDTPFHGSTNPAS